MLKSTTLSAAIATVFSTLITSNLLISPKDTNHSSLQANKSELTLKDATLNSTGLITPNLYKTADTTKLIADSSTDTPDVREKVGSGMILGLAAVGGAIGIALSARNAKQPLKSSSTNPYSGLNFNFDKESTVRIEQASRQLRKKLLRLLHDDRGAANRLLSQVKLKNPNKSIDWCAEKVIYDLERDRGSY